MKGLAIAAREAIVALTARPVRTAITGLGTAIGVSALIVSSGMSGTGSGQIMHRFDEFAPTHISAEVDKPVGDSDSARSLENSVSRVSGVTSAAIVAAVTDAPSVGVKFPMEQSYNFPVFTASGDIAGATGSRLLAGRWFDWGHVTRGDQVAVIGHGTAEALGIVSLNDQPVVRMGDVKLTVIGIIADSAYRPDFVNALIIPTGSLGLPSTPKTYGIDVHVESGRASAVGNVLALAIDPTKQAHIDVIVPPTPDAVRRAIAGDSSAIAFITALSTLVAGALVIAALMYVSVAQRSVEIGIRRAIGARKRQIMAQFMCEAAFIGFAASCLGVGVGAIVVFLVSVSQGWSPVVSYVSIILGIVTGCSSGLVAGIIPSLKAARLDPFEAIRR